MTVQDRRKLTVAGAHLRGYGMTEIAVEVVTIHGPRVVLVAKVQGQIVVASSFLPAGDEVEVLIGAVLELEDKAGKIELAAVGRSS